MADDHPQIICVLEVDGVPVDPSVPRWFTAEPYTAEPGAPQDWSGWTDLGATTDEIPPAFRRRTSHRG
ncbi:MAG TPA: hypothetical protein VGG54_22585 [Trebonia sp.]